MKLPVVFVLCVSPTAVYIYIYIGSMGRGPVGAAELPSPGREIFGVSTHRPGARRQADRQGLHRDPTR